MPDPDPDLNLARPPTAPQPAPLSRPVGRVAGWLSRALPAAVAMLALGAICVAVDRLESARQGVTIEASRLGSTPVTVFRPAAASPAAGAAAGGPVVEVDTPVVLIAHGFAGSQQLMQPFALTLARNGYVAVTFDFPGHGRNAAPMRGGLADQDASHRTLLASMAAMGRHASDLATALRSAVRNRDPGSYAVIGHSMASDIVVRHAQAQPAVLATVGVSMFAPSIGPDTPPDSPRNLLVIDGALEPGLMAGEALRVVARVAGPGAVVDTTYGRFADGTARRATLSPGAEHIGVLYSAHTLTETLNWLDATFERSPPPAGTVRFIDDRGGALGLLLLGVVALAWPLSKLLPRLATPAAGAPASRLPWWGWRGQATLTLLPALLTPLILWQLPTDVLPILLGDHLLLHFGLCGLLTLAGLAWAGRWPAVGLAGRRRAFAVAVLAASAYALLAVGLPVDRYVFNVVPEAGRLPLIAALCVGTVPWFLADEWLTRDPAAPRGAYLASKVAFLLSLVLAIALNPQRLFFLAIIVPAILLLFTVYGLFSRWVHARTGQPAVAALANALAFGCFIAVTFPLVA